MHVLTELGWLEVAGKATVVVLYAGVLGGFVVTFLRDAVCNDSLHTGRSDA